MPWVIVRQNQICSAHCDCKAGLGEVCTHIATLLFGIDAGVRIRETKTVTQVKAYWMEPTRKQVKAAPVTNVDFSSAAMKKKLLDAAIDGTEPRQQQKDRDKAPSLLSPSYRASVYLQDKLLSTLVLRLSRIATNAAIFSSVEPYAATFVPAETVEAFPPILTDLMDKNTFTLTFAELLKICEAVNYSVTEEGAKNVEAHTRQQAKSETWFRYRAGRITASKMKSVCTTNAGSPAISVVKSVCYPHLYKFSTEATRWGCDQEKRARQAYAAHMRTEHSGFMMRDSGLIINPKYPHLGATPDGLVECAEQCCGADRLGLCEIKCPFSKKGRSLMSAAQDKTISCLGDFYITNE
ncbi:uncharacterized protein LOC129694714 [Leucoraja erinacea]|uniref:uncharacterized protein LOC129694714 n=1 Tax=Leucoraja erinaceus TaxID=7782 RepID=UPI002454C5D2|nr:uncharacterized protein LOC129694714 [Leucoraja erinacea]